MKKVISYSFRLSIPVLVSFMPLGIAYGILMQASGYGPVITGGTSFFVFAGSLQFLMISLYGGTVSYLTCAVMAAFLNSRHLFYGIPFIDKWKDYGFWKYFLIFSLIDETFPLHLKNDFDDGSERHRMFSYVLTAAFVWSYWVGFSVLGALIGTLISFEIKGIDFAMTALFLVILTEQIKTGKTAFPAAVAAASSLLCLYVLGPSNFMLPALLLTVIVLVFCPGKGGGEDEG